MLRVVQSPLLYPPGALRSSEVVLVLRLAEPISLASGLGGLSAVGFCAVLLALPITVVGSVHTPAEQAFALGFRLHAADWTDRHGRASRPGFASTALATREGSKTQEEEPGRRDLGRSS